MKKIIEKNEDEIEVCANCIEEVRWSRNDWDSFQICDNCDKDNFSTHGGLKVIPAIHRQIIEIEYEETCKELFKSK